MEVDERADGQHQGQDPEAARVDRQQRQEDEDREEVALVHARGQDEEGQREEDGGQQDRAARIAPGELDGPDREAQAEQEGPDREAVEPRQQRHLVGRPAAGGGQRRLPAGADEGPRVIGVDAQVGVAGGGVAHARDQRRHVEAERGDEDEQDHRPHGRAADQPPDALFLADPAAERPGHRRRARPGADQEEVAPQQGHPDERREDDAELGLDQRRHDGEPDGGLGEAVDQEGDGDEHDQRADRVDLAPQRRVVPGDRVEEVQRGRPQRGAARIRPRSEPATDEAVEEVRDAQVGGDRRQLDQPADDRVGQRQDDPAEGDRAAAKETGQAAADRSDEPQHVEVAGRVVGEAGVGVEAAGAAVGQRQGPRGEAADVALEAGAREEDVCDDESQRQPDQEQDGDGGDGRGRPVRASRRRAPRCGLTRPRRCRVQPASCTSDEWPAV